MNSVMLDEAASLPEDPEELRALQRGFWPR